MFKKYYQTNIICVRQLHVKGQTVLHFILRLCATCRGLQIYSGHQWHAMIHKVRHQGLSHMYGTSVMGKLQACIWDKYAVKEQV